MPLVHRFADFLRDLQLLERAVFPGDATKILETFTRHTPFGTGAVYFRDRDSLRLAAKTQQCVAPEILDESALDPRPRVVVPLRNHREDIGVLALHGPADATEEDVAMVKTAADFLSTLITNQRLLQETREGDFQLKYRLWELESLYDIGLSIASTLNVDELADEILFRMISLTNARRAALYLRDGNRFTLYREFGEVKTNTLAYDMVTERPEDAARTIFPDASSAVAVPIKGNNAIIGVLAAADRETREGGVVAFDVNELRLLSLFATQVAVALENARLHKEALAKQAMERELELAATIQRDILPKSIPRRADTPIATLARPARQVGGDYHAFFEREGVLTMMVADVAGKSMPAALLVSAFHAATQLLFAEGREIGEIATELNRHIHNWSAENKFVTVIMASIDRENDTLEYINAGHNPGYVIVGDRIEMLKSHGLPIGILGNSKYMCQRRPFPPGSAVVLYSDGITEAENVAGDEFDNARLEELLSKHHQASPSELRDRIIAAVDNFVGEAPQKDDQTMVIARRT